MKLDPKYTRKTPQNISLQNLPISFDSDKDCRNGNKMSESEATNFTQNNSRHKKYNSVPVAFWEGKCDVDDIGRHNITNTDIIMHEKDSCNEKNLHEYTNLQKKMKINKICIYAC